MGRPKKDVSIREIAKEADVSIATVSRVLNNRSDVSDGARERVRRILGRHSFVPAPSGGKRRNIGVLFLDENPIISDYSSLIMAGVADMSYLRNLELTLIFVRLDGTQKSLVDSLRDRGCHSSILITPHKVQDQLAALSESGIPSVLVNWREAPENLGWIDSDAFGGGLSLGRYLLGQGHRSFAFIRNVMGHDHMARENGVLKALEEFGLPSENMISIPLAPAKDPIDSAMIQTSQALREKPDLTAIVAVNDNMAYGAIRACVQAGRRVPYDISVAGFDDCHMSRYFIPSVTTVRQPLFEMGRLAAEYAAESMRPGATVRPPSLVMPTELIVRESTGPSRRV